MNSEIVLPADELLQGHRANGIYKTHWVITDPDGTRIIGKYPVKEYPLKEIYGKGVIPVALYSEKCLQWAADNFEYFKERQVKAFILFSNFYADTFRPTEELWGLYGYRYSAAYNLDIDAFIKLAHEAGFLVICYMRGPMVVENKKELWHGQSLKWTLWSMAMLIYRHRLDGLYADPFDCGTVLDSLRFVRSLRQVADGSARRNGFEHGWLMMHGSYSIAGNKERQGLRDIAIRQECDLFLAGESIQPGGAPMGLDSPCMVNFHDTRGYSNTPWSYKWKRGISTTYPGDVVAPEQVAAMIAEGDGYLTLTRYNQELWESTYWQAFCKQRAKYLAGGER